MSWGSEYLMRRPERTKGSCSRIQKSGEKSCRSTNEDASSPSASKWLFLRASMNLKDKRF